MKIINNKPRIRAIIKETNFQSFFSHDISEITELISAEEGEMIINEGTPSDYLFYLIEGQCSYFSLTSSGTFVSFGAEKKYRFFGEVSSLWNETPTSSVQAITKVFCLAISLKKYRDILTNDITFLRYTCKTLANRVNNLDNTLSTYIGSNVRERLAAFIIQNMSSDEIFSKSLVSTSNALGTSYRHLLRVIDGFCKEGILKKDKRRYFITDLKKLKSIASESYAYFY